MARSGINKREIDKWAKNLVRETNKSLERAQRRNPPRVSTQIEATSGPVPGEVTGYLARLLLWLDDREKQNPGGYINVTAFPEELRLEDEDPAILALQLDQWHPAGLGDETAKELYDILPPEEFPQYVTFADGTPIPDEYVTHIRDVGLDLAVDVDWREGDVLVIDNVLTAHGRRPFEGTRRILVAMCD
ncbi:TauD/TfdA family dioxygenase [Streptomyces sp. NPDC093991]|uniref:TauD/TfdA family dioxygenase n=1 Tax=unclassified Streptomyces TaxID=2593676 RepID=UPI003449B433